MRSSAARAPTGRSIGQPDVMETVTRHRLMHGPRSHATGRREIRAPPVIRLAGLSFRYGSP